jgi:hypothetical protein
MVSVAALRALTEPPLPIATFMQRRPSNSDLGNGDLCRTESRLPEFKGAHNFCRDLVAKKPRRGLKIVRVIWGDGQG